MNVARRSVLSAGAVTGGLVALSACDMAQVGGERAETESIEAPQPTTDGDDEGHAVNWGYTGDIGPAQWGDLSPAFAACKLGESQSPIDLADAPNVRPHELEFRYAAAPLEIANNGHTIQVNYAPGSTLIDGGKEFALVQFHFHRLSEHTVSGQPTAMELHLVHQDAAGGLAVVGVLLTSGRHNRSLDQVWTNMPTGTDEKRVVAGATVNAAELLPADLSYFSYMGSLTTPPCSEDVRWYVLRDLVEVSPAQIERFAVLYPDNARPTQPLNGRVVSYSQQRD